MRESAGSGDVVRLVKYLSTKHVDLSLGPINYVKMPSRMEWFLQSQHFRGETRCLGAHRPASLSCLLSSKVSKTRGG